MFRMKNIWTKTKKYLNQKWKIFELSENGYYLALRGDGATEGELGVADLVVSLEGDISADLQIL